MVAKWRSSHWVSRGTMVMRSHKRCAPSLTTLVAPSVLMPLRVTTRAAVGSGAGCAGSLALGLMQKRDERVGDFRRLPVAVNDRAQVSELQLEQG